MHHSSIIQIGKHYSLYNNDIYQKNIDDVITMYNKIIEIGYYNFFSSFRESVIDGTLYSTPNE